MLVQPVPEREQRLLGLALPVGRFLHQRIDRRRGRLGQLPAPGLVYAPVNLPDIV
ncbi:hypothetical protein D3C87_2077920 [compost metagenome]